MDGELPDTFDVLCDRIASSRGREAFEFASVTVRYATPRARPDRFTAAVLIDGRRVVNLIGHRPGRFTVEPGKHEIVVYFATESHLSAGCLDKSTRQSLTLTLSPGEDVELGCGKRPAWVVFETESRLCRWLYLGGSWLVATIVWFGYPFLRALIPRIVDRWNIRGPLFWLMYRLVDRRINTITYFILVWLYLVTPLILFRYRRRMVQVRRQFGGLYYLEGERRSSPEGEM
jgi:hypothetical protein